MSRKNFGKASVILPTKNNEEHIESLLESIFSQSFKGEIEVLMLDSSADRTPEVAERYIKTTT